MYTLIGVMFHRWKLGIGSHILNMRYVHLLLGRQIDPHLKEFNISSTSVSRLASPKTLRARLPLPSSSTAHNLRDTSWWISPRNPDAESHRSRPKYMSRYQNLDADAWKILRPPHMASPMPCRPFERSFLKDLGDRTGARGGPIIKMDRDRVYPTRWGRLGHLPMWAKLEWPHWSQSKPRSVWKKKIVQPRYYCHCCCCCCCCCCRMRLRVRFLPMPWRRQHFPRAWWDDPFPKDLAKDLAKDAMTTTTTRVAGGHGKQPWRRGLS
jgi:hypothetical protein